VKIIITLFLKSEIFFRLMYSEDMESQVKRRTLALLYHQTIKILHSARELYILTNSIFKEQIAIFIITWKIRIRRGYLNY